MSERLDDSGSPLVIPEPPRPVEAERGIPPPDNNIMMHAYREMTDQQMQRMRDIKDAGLQLWNELHAIDGSAVEDRMFDSWDLQQAGLRLEEAMLWVEKHFLR